MITEILLGTFSVGVVAWFIGIGSFRRVMLFAERCESAQFLLDTQLRHRNRLIPTLAGAVKNVIGDETVMLDELVEAHAIAMQTPAHDARIVAEGVVTDRLRDVLAQLETNLDVQVSPEFAEIREKLNAVEAEIVAERRRYNLAVKDFNGAIATFPDNIIAARLGLAPRPLSELGLHRWFANDLPSARS